MNRKELLDHIRQIDRTDLENKFIKLYDALDHIKTIISMARTETRRLRWILARVNYALDFKDWDYPDLEMPREKVKIKLHPMSEEPERYRRFIILNDKYEPIESDCISELAVYCEVAKYTDEWMSIAPTPKAKSWAYADELSQLIKNNTAP